MRLDCVALHRAVERCPGVAEAQAGELSEQGGSPQVRVVRQPPPAVGGERGEVVGPGRGLARHAEPVDVGADRGDAVPVGLGDLADWLPGGMIGQDLLGAVPGQRARHGFGVLVRGGGAWAVMSTVIWSRLLRVSFSVPSRMA